MITLNWINLWALRALTTEEYNEYIGDKSTTLSTTQNKEKEEDLKPSKLQPLSENDKKEYNKPSTLPALTKPVYKEGDPLPSEKLIEEVKEEESKLQDLSVKDLETDPELIEDILQYREDRFGTPKDVGAKNIFIGNFIGGTQELTDKNVVDDYLDHFRFVRNNFGEAQLELNWLRGLKQKEEEALKAFSVSGKKADSDRATNFAEQRARALRLYTRADSLAGFDKKRYENMSTGEMVNDIVGSAGATVLSILSDPYTFNSRNRTSCSRKSYR